LTLTASIEVARYTAKYSFVVTIKLTENSILNGISKFILNVLFIN